MKYLQRLEVTFEASHQWGTNNCEKLHGHSFIMRMVHEVNPTDESAMAEADRFLKALVAEIDGRHLNEQLPATTPNTVGVAAWAFERLNMLVPGLVSMECEVAFGETGIVAR